MPVTIQPATLRYKANGQYQLADSIKGDKGDPGNPGATPQFTVGSIATGDAGSDVSVTITGTAAAPVLNMSIPKGDKGNTGATPNFSIGTVETGAAGTNATVTITGTPEAPVLNLSIPRGFAGPPGAGNLIAPDYYELEFPVAKGQHCIHDGWYYEANDDIATSEDWTPAHWTKISTLGDEINGLAQRIADLEYVPIDINTLTVAPSLAEKGSTCTSATLTYAMNRDATQMQLDNNNIQNKSANGTISLTGLSLTADKTWTLRATDERKSLLSEWVSKTVKLTFTNKVKYGVAAAPGAINDAFLNGLATRTLSTAKIKSFSVNAGSGQYIWYALPSSYGTCKFTVGGFTGGFTLVSTFNHTNESGATVEYNVYRSDNANLGSQTVSVS